MGFFGDRHLTTGILLSTLLLTGGLAAARVHVAADPPAGRASDHGGHGTPGGWRLAWPPGDPARGRDVFVKLECYSCHEVKGERFPAPRSDGTLGPELATMGPLHPPEYFAEAIINPGAVIEPGQGYAAADGSSRMPSYNDSVTVQEVIDLVAYLKALRPPAGSGAATPGGHGGHR
jgi:hypothetical protein